MNRKKLLKKIQQFFDRHQDRQGIDIKKLNSILNKLKKKKRKLLNKIQHETDETSIRQYQIELEILNKQLEKGENALLENQELIKDSSQNN